MLYGLLYVCLFLYICLDYNSFYHETNYVGCLHERLYVYVVYMYGQIRGGNSVNRSYGNKENFCTCPFTFLTQICNLVAWLRALI